MYLPHTSVFHNRAFSSRGFVDEELQKAKYSISSLAKIVAFSVLLIVMTIGGLSGLGLVTMQNQSTADNTIEATKQDLQANLVDVTNMKTQIEQLQKSNQQHEANHVADMATLRNEIKQLERSNQQHEANHVADMATLRNKTEHLEKSNQQHEANHVADMATLRNKSEHLEQSNQQHEANHVADMATLRNKTEHLEKSNQQMSSRTDALSMNINSLKDEFNILSRNQNASDIVSRDHNSRLQTLNKTLIEGLEKLEKTNSPVQQVAFLVHTPTEVNEASGAPLFANIVLNDGSAYNSERGIFTCPVNGLYLFTQIIVGDSKRDKYIQCELHHYVLKNRSTPTLVATNYNWKQGKNSASMTVFLHAHVGDGVEPQCFYNWDQAEKSSSTIFSGALIRAD